MQLNILRVYPKVREFSGKNGPLAVVKVAFDDDTEGEYLTTPDAAPKIQEALTAFIGKPTDFELGEEKEYQGVTQRKIKSWPGKQSSGGFAGGGGKQWTPAWSQTEAGERYLHERMDRRTALISAKEFCKSDDPVEVCVVAQKFYVWLRASDTPSQPERANTPINMQNASPQAIDRSTDVVEETPALPGMGKINTGAALCESCFAPPGKPHAKGCTA